MKSETYVHVPTWQDYPCSDGKPMSDNTWQFNWISMLAWELGHLFRDDPNVFIAGDILWYPIEDDRTTRVAPDVMVALGRPNGPRDSYLQWVEGGQPPQVVIEVLSPKNTPKEMKKKLKFYRDHGVTEYYIFDTYGINHSVEGYIRQDGKLVKIETIEGWVSPLLNIRIEIEEEEVAVYHPDGERFIGPKDVRLRLVVSEEARRELFETVQEERRLRREETRRADRERELREQETQRADQERMRADRERELREQATQRAEEERELREQATQRADQQAQLAEQRRLLAEQAEARMEEMAAQLRALGIEPKLPPN